MEIEQYQWGNPIRWSDIQPSKVYYAEVMGIKWVFMALTKPQIVDGFAHFRLRWIYKSPQISFNEIKINRDDKTAFSVKSLTVREESHNYDCRKWKM
jgi:hypothetical protein